jgi:two-component system nitrogen regulation response regulator GlnG
MIHDLIIANTFWGMSLKILVVDDEVLIRWFIEKALKDLGYQVETTSSSSEAIKMLEENDFNVLISDIVMPGTSGLELISQVQKLNKATSIIACSAFFTEDILEAFGKKGIFALKKPFDQDELRQSLERTALQAK